MAIHDTISEANIRRSLKKHFVDNLETVESVTVMFDRLYQDPHNDVTKWICVRTQDLLPDHVSSIDAVIYLFTKRDQEGDLLAELRDTVFNYMINPIPLYDISWNVVGYMKVFHESESDTAYLPDNGKMKSMVFSLKWGAIY